MLFLIPIVWLPNFLSEPFQLPKLVVLRIGTAVALALWFLRCVKNQSITISRRAIDIPILSFLLIAVLSTAFSISLETSLNGYKTSYEGLYTLINYGLIYLLASQSITEKSHAKIIIHWMLAGGLIVAGYGLLQKTGLDFVSWESAADIARSFSTLGNPIHLGGYLSLLLPLGVSLVLSNKISRNLKLALTVVNLILATVLYFTYTRASWIAAFTGLCIILVLSWSYVKTALRPLVIALIALLGGILILSFISPTSSIYLPAQRLLSATSQGQERIAIWAASLPSISQRPILGHGPATAGLLNPIADITHNWLLETAVNMGVFGFLALLWIIIALSMMLLARIKTIDDHEHRLVIVGLLSASLAYFIHMFFSLSYAGPPALWWAGLGLAISLVPHAAGRDVKISLPKGFNPNVAPAVLTVLVLLYIVRFTSILIAEKNYTEGARALSNQMYSLAEQNFNRAIALDPSNSRYQMQLSEAYFWLAISTQQEQYFSAADNSLQKSIARNPFDERPYFLLIQLYLLFGDNDRATQVLNNLLAKNPITEDSSTTYKSIASIFKQAGLNEQAGVALKKAASIDQITRAFKR
ncbi:MAG: O-antigen ligase family protein [Actinomycetota bacterium]|nr:O-antigen ligase family protein [Actinomycetota bacterium]